MEEENKLKLDIDAIMSLGIIFAELKKNGFQIYQHLDYLWIGHRDDEVLYISYDGHDVGVSYAYKNYKNELDVVTEVLLPCFTADSREYLIKELLKNHFPKKEEEEKQCGDAVDDLESIKTIAKIWPNMHKNEKNGWC